ncbi:MAG: zinc ribbon domain-containing protein [Anaerolineae bacterium]|nr:zinc ribbon domain-containing protein [Anaerolineae bacterium]
MSSERDLGTYEMLWDCKFCGAKKLLGLTHRHCPNCGAAQDPELRYFPSDAEKIAVEDHVYYGADVICEFCDTPNGAKAQFCMNCGAPLTEAARVKQQADQVKQAGEQFEAGRAESLAERLDQEDYARTQPAASGGGGVNWKILAVVAVVVVVIGGLIFMFTRTTESSAYVTGHSWERQIDIEAYGPVSDSAWCDSMPGGAYNITRRQEQRSTRQVPDGEECSVRRVDNGDGTFSEREECRTKYRDEPVYDDKCYFTIDRWAHARTVTASGDSLRDAPYWPDTNITRTGTCNGCEREGNRSERYTVRLKDSESGKEYSCNLDEAAWKSMGIETRWKLEVRSVTGDPVCDTLERAP